MRVKRAAPKPPARARPRPPRVKVKEPSEWALAQAQRDLLAGWNVTDHRDGRVTVRELSYAGDTAVTDDIPMSRDAFLRARALEYDAAIERSIEEQMRRGFL